MRKLFASDFDGTIHFWDTDDQYLVSPADTQAIRAFQERGGLFGVCTGRPLRGLTRQTDGRLDFSFDFYIAMSGATVFDAEQCPIMEKSIPRVVVEELYRRYEPLSEGGRHVLLCADNDYWTLHDRSSMVPISRATSLADLPDPFCGMALMFATEREAARVADEVSREYGEVVAAFQNGRSIDVMCAGCSKGEGLRLAAAHFGADVTAGIGDSFNDVPMLDAADVAYTFAGSADEVRAHADVLVDTAAQAVADFAGR